MNINKMQHKKIISAATALAIMGSLIVTVPVFADTNPTSGNMLAIPHGQGNQGQQPQGRTGAPGQGFGRGMMNGVRPAAVGTVTAVSGNIITINARQGFGSTSATTVLTVDATNATVLKNNATSSISSVVVGDMIVVQGTLSGTNIVATSVHDGMMRAAGTLGARGQNGNGSFPGGMGSTTPSIGNGEPVVAGTVASISGSVLTITTKSNVTYTIDASNAKILAGQGNTTSTISSITVGDTLLVQGTINGTSVAATSVVDQAHPVTPVANGNNQKNVSRGFFGGIGQFFMHIFGF